MDDKDDGRRLRLALLDENGHQLYAGSTDGAQPWAAPSIDIATKSWSRTGAHGSFGGVDKGPLSRGELLGATGSILLLPHMCGC